MTDLLHRRQTLLNVVFGPEALRTLEMVHMAIGENEF
jgi:hypothetical protein